MPTWRGRPRAGKIDCCLRRAGVFESGYRGAIGSVARLLIVSEDLSRYGVPLQEELVRAEAEAILVAEEISADLILLY
jgi:hypothetical protein